MNALRELFLDCEPLFMMAAFSLLGAFLAGFYAGVAARSDTHPVDRTPTDREQPEWMKK